MTRPLKWTLRALAGLLVLALLAAGGGYLYLRQSLPQTEGEVALAALDAPVTVVRDANGIPTIRAESLADAYRALGFLHAQDRLWQMDFTRRTAHGRLSEVVGGQTVELDTFMRTLALGRLAERQVRHLSEETRAALEAYAAGVNAFLARDPVLPLEFQILGYEPAPWTPADSLTWVRLMALKLSGNYRDELTRAALRARLTPDQLDFLYPDSADGAATTIARREAAALGRLERQLAAVLPHRLEPKSASNAVALARQADGGGPYLANDPHLELRAPGHWYLARIETPGTTRVGATAPGLPFHVLGRNRELAWGLTTTHSDTQDLFLERLDPDARDRYRTPDGWRAFETREEAIPVAGGEPVTHTVRRSRHGPVISDVVPAADRLAAANQAVALAWPALRADDRTPDAIRRVNAASSVAGAMAAMDLAGSPHQNLFLADSGGHIGVIAAARVPIRKNGDGSLPRPGWTGAFDWTGTIPFADLPRARDPGDGRLINANNRLVGPDYPHLIAAHWPPPWRAERIAELLDRADAPVGADDLERILLDTRSPKAALLLETLLSYKPQTRRQEAAHQLLRGWDRRMTRAGRAPLVFTAWLDRLNRALFKDELGASFRSFARPDPRLIRRALTDRPGWCDDVTTAATREDCAGQVTGALAAALENLRERFGEAESWRWGRAHVARFPHPLFSRIPGLGGLLAPEIATPGGDETVNRGGAHYRGPAEQRYAHIHGATLRMVHDLSRPPSSTRVTLSDGQSGNPLSEHFGGLTTAWRDGKSLKLVGAGQDAGQTLRLTPGKR